MNASELASAIPYLISFAAVIGTFYGIQHTNRINIRLQNDRLRSEEKLKHQEVLRSKGEELYALIDAFEAGFREATGGATTALIKRNRQEAVDSLDMRSCKTGLLTLTMLTKVYFPSAEQSLNEVRSRWELLGKAAIKVAESVDQRRMDDTAKELLVLSANMDESTQKLQQEVIQVLKSLHADAVGSARLSKVA